MSVITTGGLSQNDAASQVAGIVLLSKVSGVDLTSAGATLLTDCSAAIPAGMSFIPQRIVNASTDLDSANGDGAMSLGTNAATYNDITASVAYFATGAVGEWTVTDLEQGGNPNSLFTALTSASNDIYINVSAGDTGTTATFTFYLYGYLYTT